MIKQRKMLHLKITLHFSYAYKKINSTLTDNAEELDIVMLMYNLLESSASYPMISGSFWNYYRDNIDEVNDNALESKSFK